MMYYLIKPAQSVLIISLIALTGCSLFLKREQVPDYFAIAEAYYQEFDYDNALENFLQAAELDSTNADIYYKIGLIYGYWHSIEDNRHSIIAGQQNQKDRVRRSEESNFRNAVKYFRKASELGSIEARQILRAMYDNIRHLDIKY